MTFPLLAIPPLTVAPAGWTPDPPSYSHPLSTGRRLPGVRPFYTGNGTTTGASIHRLCDGVSTGVTNVLGWSVGATTATITFDFGINHSFIITEFKLAWSSNNTHGTWVVEGSNDLSGWTQIGSSFTLGGSTLDTITAPSANTTGYRAYRLRQTAGTTSTASSLQQVDFKIGDAIEVQTQINHPQSMGNRTSTITPTVGTFVVNEGALNNLFDGDVTTADFTVSSVRFNAATTGFFKFDFGTAVIMDMSSIQWSQSHAGWNCTLEGSNDDSIWTNIFTNQAMHNQLGYGQISFTNTTAYRYYRFSRSAGNMPTSPRFMEWEFGLRDPAP